GGTLGAVLGAFFAAGTITVPGVGLIAAGSLAAMFAGAGAGGLTGGLIGWLTSWGIPEDVAPYYEHGLGEGGIVVGVSCHPGDEQRVQQILQGGSIAYTGYNVPSYVSPEFRGRYADINPPIRRV